jgi:hypothetical protein
MCTASWLHDESGYWLFFNRDEKRDRRQAHPPEKRTVRGVRYLAPVDGDFGGTWIAVNEFGLSVCLLNRYGSVTERLDDGGTSRGLLVNALVDAHSRDEVIARLRETDLDRFRPFSVLVFMPGEAVAVMAWDGRSLAQCDADTSRVPFVSSSVLGVEATAARTAALASLATVAGRLTPVVLEEFHASHIPERGALSACMHRDDASTVSSSIIRVSRTEAEFRYREGPPCALGRITRLRLRLAVRAGAAS